ncbi:MAG: putative penicillin acylase [Solirubrobacteraceae bacterium]|nr:putative penicillin acylase [Solirubrobacteraceae bacterium]
MLPRSILASLLLAALAAAPASARPGPDLLYAKAAVAPQLTNAGIWKAPPILVSGTTAYRKGEFLYQDYLYDDHGAQETPDPGDPRTAGDLFSKPNGTYTYPTAAGYAGNAADIVEFRLKPLKSATAFRLTLNTLKDPSLVAFSITLGDVTSPSRPLPFGANVSAPANVVVTVHPKKGGGLTSSILKAGPSEYPDGTASVRLDRTRRQIEVRLPHRVWNPGRGKRRVGLGVGLWDAAAGQYLLPQATADATHPGGGGAGGAPAAFFNVAYRTHEDVGSPTEGTSVETSAAWWRDRQQGVDLAKGDMSRFAIDVDFNKLARGVTDNHAVPKTGAMDRILPSHFELHQGTDFSQQCLAAAATCPGQYQSRLQPYAIYIPRKKMQKPGYGMTLLMHSLSANYNQYLGTRNQSQFGERGGGSIVITPEARGPDEDYQNYGAADVFDVWNDVARRYRLDKTRTVATGYSMGGVGSFVLGEQFPDLFARIQPTVGFETNPGLEASLRNVPVLMWNNHGDELANEALFNATAAELDTLGYRYELDAFQPCDNAQCSPLFPNHLQLAVNDQFAPAAAFLDDAAVDSNPAHVTYLLDTARNHKELGMVGDHAYWISGLTARDASTSAAGTDPGGSIDVVSHASGAGEPVSTSMPPGSGTLAGGNLGPLVFTRTGKTWAMPPAGAAADTLTVSATNIATATIDPKRAGVTCAAKVDITSDGPLAVTLAGCNRTVTGG